MGRREVVLNMACVLTLTLWMISATHFPPIVSNIWEKISVDVSVDAQIVEHDDDLVEPADHLRVLEHVDAGSGR